MKIEKETVEQEPKSIPSLKEVILQCAFAKGRAIPDDVREIDLGVFAKESNELRLKTRDDKDRREFGKIVYITRDGKVLVKIKPFIGEKESVDIEVRVNIFNKNSSLPWFVRQNRIVGSSIHSHPVDRSPSHKDLSWLLLDDSDSFAYVSVFVVTPNRNIVIFRRNESSRSQKMDIQDKPINEGVVIEILTELERLGRANKVQEVLLRQIAKKFNLRIFSGDVNSSIVRLQAQ